MEITYSAAFTFLEALLFPEYTFGPVVEQTEPVKERAHITGSTTSSKPSITGSFGGIQTIQ